MLLKIKESGSSMVTALPLIPNDSTEDLQGPAVGLSSGCHKEGKQWK